MVGGPIFWGLEVGDWATWIGGFASAAAAIAAWYAANKAIEIAQMPIREARKDRQETARVFAGAIAVEMRDVANAAVEFIASTRVIFDTGHGNGMAYLRQVRFNPMFATARAIPFITCFASKDAAYVMSVIGAKGTLDDRIGKLGAIDPNHWNLRQELHVAIGDAEARARDLFEAAEQAEVAMRRYVPLD